MKVALNVITLIPKPRCQSKIDNPDNPATQGTQDEDKQNKNTIRVGQHYSQINAYNVNLQDMSHLTNNWLEVKTKRTSFCFYAEIATDIATRK